MPTEALSGILGAHLGYLFHLLGQISVLDRVSLSGLGPNDHSVGDKFHANFYIRPVTL